MIAGTESRYWSANLFPATCRNCESMRSFLEGVAEEFSDPNAVIAGTCFLDRWSRSSGSTQRVAIVLSRGILTRVPTDSADDKAYICEGWETSEGRHRSSR